ncbi:MAG: serine/threonine protein kinase [Myxococcales bacterium]|nr:serine/threonine protein kinase [Myxococcales bacterium]MCB9642449.1 serine/threonine protein kinase [Myxococcales bacterium]
MKCAQCKRPLPDLRSACSCGQDPYAGLILNERYELLGELGAGGMGLIYRALKLDDGTLCVIKISRWGKALEEMRQLDPAEAREEERARIEREFTLLQKASSRSKHVVHVYDTFAEDPRVGLYYPMEFLDGQPLSQIDGWGQPIDPARVLKLMAQINEGIGVAHGLGVVHRDLNADNIFIVNFEGTDDFVKLIDFGIARNLYNRRKLFQTGDHLAFGHLDFLAPEQVGYSHATQNYDREVAAKLDHRADIYSLGVMMFMMLTGFAPFETKTFEDLALRDWEYPPGLEQAIDDGLLIGGLRDIVSACLQPDPDQRPPDVLVLGDMLSHQLRAMQQNPTLADPHAETLDITHEFGEIELPDDLDTLGASLIDSALQPMPSQIGLPSVRSSQAANPSPFPAVPLAPTPPAAPKAPTPPPPPAKAKATPPPPPPAARAAVKPNDDSPLRYLDENVESDTVADPKAPWEQGAELGAPPSPDDTPQPRSNGLTPAEAHNQKIKTNFIIILGVAGVFLILSALFFLTR